MGLQKRLDYGSSGHQVPPMPLVPRSARGKRSVRKRIENKQISAFDLLATVAGELLSGRENFTSPFKMAGSSKPAAMNGTIKQEQQEVEMPLKGDVFDQGSCNESTLGCETVFKRQVGHEMKEPPKTEPTPLEKVAWELLINGKKGDESRWALPEVDKKLSFNSNNNWDCKAEIGIKIPLQAERRMNGNIRGENALEILEDPMDLDAKPPALVSSDSSVEVPISRSRSFPRFTDGMQLPVVRDDDDISSGCTHPSTMNAKAFKPQRVGDRMTRKPLGSRFWEVPSASLKDEMKPIFRGRKMCYTRQRTQRSSFKRRKLYERCAVSASTGCIYGEGIPSSPKFEIMKIEAGEPNAIPNGEIGASSYESGQKTSFESEDYHVKFSIKSFKVPELFIEIPETATVGSLKRTVMEAVTAILAGGLRVGVLLQGKKVRDDRQTLLQAGISHDDKVVNLGFTLEPNSTQTLPSLACSDDSRHLLPANPPVIPCAYMESVPRTPIVIPAKDQRPPETAHEPHQTSTLNGPESDRDSVHSPTDASSSVDKAANSKALVQMPDTNAHHLAMVLQRKSRRSELVQRRIRRPFSVAEVEALVQAVEKLGTGRWRDVKVTAFDNTKHRTYVDLKDKWKTLVHTARISPQQRRGEPVPQGLLDRVLAAHAYWSHRQAKFQVKPSHSGACLLI